MSIYLDYNASAPIDPLVLGAMIDVYKNAIGNPDSRTHEYGDNVRNIVETARKQVASLLKISPLEVIFTSGATESNNIAIQGLENYAKKSGKRHIITSSIEHKSVLETVKAMKARGYEIDIIDPEPSGYVDKKKVLDKVNQSTLLVSIMHVNNETGIIQPVLELGEKLEDQEILFHVDATQSCGKMVEELRQLKYNMLTFSSHKLRGPQGVGVLVLKRKKYQYPPVNAIIFGGQQEHGIRPGTIPAALVAGCGKACEIAEIQYKDNHSKLAFIKNSIITMLSDSGLDYSINGDQDHCIDSTINICLNGVSAEALMISTKQYCGISNGSACTSKSYSPSYVLSAMGISTEKIENSIRISWGPDTDIAKLNIEFPKLLSVAKQLIK